MKYVVLISLIVLLITLDLANGLCGFQLDWQIEFHNMLWILVGWLIIYYILK